MARPPFVAPPLGGVPASAVWLPAGPWPTVLDALCARFPAVGRAAWVARFGRGRILDDGGRPLGLEAPHGTGARVHYYREVAAEPAVALAEAVLHADDDLVVADKPHFMPVMPGGARVAETLIARLIRRLGNPDLVPLHRIDRHTAGLVLLSARPATRAAYQELFRQRRITKRYQCLAPALPAQRFPLIRRTRLGPGQPFFRTAEVAGAPNSESRIDVVARDGAIWRYALEPVTGRTHQLRVHMAGLGAPIVGDPFYPTLTELAPDDHDRPLQLVAHALEFVDPLSGAARRFESRLGLAMIRGQS